MHWKSLVRAASTVFAAALWLAAPAHAASCETAAAFARSQAIPPQACKVVDNGTAKLRVCTGETPDSIRVEVPDRAGGGPFDATHVVTWFNEIDRSEPSGARYTSSGTIFVGPSAALSLRYKDYVRGDSAVSGAFKIPDDQVDVKSGPAATLTCAALPLKSDAEIDIVVAAFHAAR